MIEILRNYNRRAVKLSVGKLEEWEIVWLLHNGSEMRKFSRMTSEEEEEEEKKKRSKTNNKQQTDASQTTATTATTS